MPGGDVCHRLSRTIDRLSARFDAPVFPPHVTLLARCTGEVREVIRRSARLALSLRPFTIRLKAIDFRDEYFRCLFVHAALTEPLRKAHHAACWEFARRREPVFTPHLSLVYANLPPTIKEQLRGELGPQLDASFKVRSLHLYRTHGEASRWRRVAMFGFK
jgi:2'-5' RNA ligase